MSSWNDVDEFSVMGNYGTVVAPPSETPYVPTAEVAATSNTSANDSTSATSSSNTTNDSPQLGREICTAEGVRNEIASMVNHGCSLKQIEAQITAAHPGVSVDEIGKRYEECAYQNNPMNVTPGSTPEEISAKIEAEEAAKVRQGVVAIASIAAGASVVAEGGDRNAIREGFKGTISTMDYASTTLNQIKLEDGQGLSNVAANVLQVGTPEMKEAMDGVRYDGSGRAGVILGDLKGLTLDESQFSRLSPEVMAQVNSAGRTMLSDVAGVGDLPTMTATLDNSVSANAGLTTAVGGMPQKQASGRTVT